MNSKILAILITTHNSHNFIEKLLNNIKRLTDFSSKWIDIYIYDDNSQDDTLEIIDNYIINNKDMNIKVIKNNLNQGVVLARINLLKRINDDYAIFIDQDDWLDQNTLLEFKNNYKNSDFLLMKRKFIFKETNLVFDKWYKDKGSEIKNFMTHIFATYATGVFWSREIYNLIISKIDISESKNIYIYEDFPFYFVSIIFAKNPIFLNCYYNYNQLNEESLLKKDSLIKTKNDTLKVLDLINKIYLSLDKEKKNEIKVKDYFYVINIRLLLFYNQVLFKKQDKKEFKKIREHYLSIANKRKRIELDLNHRIIEQIIKSRFLQQSWKFYKKYIKKKWN